MTVEHINQHIHKIEDLGESISNKLRNKGGSVESIAVSLSTLSDIRTYLYALSDIYQRAEVKLP